MIKYESSIDHPESAPGQEPGHIVSHREAQLGGHVVAKKLPDNGKKQGLSSIPINVETSSVIIKPIVLGNLHQLVNEAGLTVKI